MPSKSLLTASAISSDIPPKKKKKNRRRPSFPLDRYDGKRPRRNKDNTTDYHGKADSGDIDWDASDITRTERKKRHYPEEVEERALAVSLFGAGIGDGVEERPEESAPFVAAATESTDDMEKEDHAEETATIDAVAPAPAWHDEDDSMLQINFRSKREKSRDSRLQKFRSDSSEEVISGSDLSDRLRARFERSDEYDHGGVPRLSCSMHAWASLPPVSGGEEDGEDGNGGDESNEGPVARLLSSAVPLAADVEGAIKEAGGPLPAHILDTVRVADANCAGRKMECTVFTMCFHMREDSGASWVACAGLDGVLRIFECDGKRNGVVARVQLPDLPIQTVSFLGNTGTIVLSGKRPYIYIYDPVEGKLTKIPQILGRPEKCFDRHAVSPSGTHIALLGYDGTIILLCGRTHHWISDHRINGLVYAVCFDSDGGRMYGAGTDGDVYVFDMKQRGRCVDRFHNDDGTAITALAAHGTTQLGTVLAVGAVSGVVNLYRLGDGSSSSSKKDGGSKKPFKSVMNLQTTINMLRFSHDGCILALASKKVTQALRLLHVPSATVFSNWPTSNTPLGYVWSLDFSPRSEFLAIGNDKGKCLLYKLQHYSEENNVQI